MRQFSLRIAGCTLEARVMFDSTEHFCRDYLCGGTPDFCVEATAEDLVFERKKSEREDALEGIPVRHFSDAYLETIALQRKIAEALFAHDILLFHGSVVAVDGQGYLFTAKSGTGKSTHTRLWREVFGQRAVMVNDDKPFLQITDGSVLAHGTPWNGKHGLGSNLCVPLKAICLLERGEQNKIEKIPAKDAVFMLLQQSNRPLAPQKLPKYKELLDKLSGGVEFYKMQCNMDPGAAVLAYEAMSGNSL